MAEFFKRETAWLTALVIANGVLALLLHGGLQERFRTLEPPQSPFTGSPVHGRWTCAAWGPFAEVGAVDGLTARIESQGGETDLIVGQLGPGPDYLLLVGPQGSFEAARRVREELESQSIDGHIVPRGPFARALEVGIFADRTLALERRARIEELGYAVDLKELRRAMAGFHLLARLDRIAVPDLPPAADCGVVAPGHRFL